MSPEDLQAFEQEKIRGAVRTDFILSAEIIVLTLGIVADMDLLTRLLVLSSIALVMTVGVYGLVAAIVKLDDAGVYLLAREGRGAWRRFQRWWGERLLNFAPRLMKALGVIGTVAMFMVGGGILLHAAHGLEVAVREFAGGLAGVAVAGPALAALAPTLAGLLLGMVAGALTLAVVTGIARLRPGS